MDAVPDTISTQQATLDAERFWAGHREKSACTKSATCHVTYNTFPADINGLGNVYAVPDTMLTRQTTLDAERFWDEGPFKPPELSDIDALSTTTSELSRVVRAYNEYYAAVTAYNEDCAEQERTNMPGFKSVFPPITTVFRSIDETGEVCSVADVSI